MNEPMKVLIPIDGSPIGESILPSIQPLLRSHRVGSTLLHIAGPAVKGATVEARLESLRKTLEGFGAQAQVRIASGRPADQILHEAAVGNYDLIAMATHGRTGVDRVLMGSVAEEVMRTSPIPTLLCRMGTRIGPWERILVSLDGRPVSEEILGDVLRLAKRLGATVHLLQVGLGLLRSDGYRGVSFHTPTADPTAYVDEVASRLIGRGIPAVAERREGIAAAEIPFVARELDAGLICMTTEGRPEQVPGLDRSVAAEVIRSAPCPVYVKRMTGVPTLGERPE